MFTSWPFHQQILGWPLLLPPFNCITLFKLLLILHLEMSTASGLMAPHQTLGGGEYIHSGHPSFQNICEMRPKSSIIMLVSSTAEVFDRLLSPRQKKPAGPGVFDSMPPQAGEESVTSIAFHACQTNQLKADKVPDDCPSTVGCPALCPEYNTVPHNPNVLT